MNANSSESKRGQSAVILKDYHGKVEIGSDINYPSWGLEVDGAAPVHAIVQWDTKKGAWYLRNESVSGETYLNEDQIGTDEIRLHEGDVIRVAKDYIRFSGNELAKVESVPLNDICVKVEHLTAKIKDGDSGGELKTLLDNVSFSVKPGSFMAIIGPSGCGKSTLIQRLAGFPLKGNLEGDISLDGNYILRNGNPASSDKTDSNCVVAYLPQAVEDTFYDDLSVAATMEHFACCHLTKDRKEVYRNKDSDFRKDLLDKVGLPWDEIATTPVKKLSGGQKRRLALALELMRNPKLLLLDEPTAGLDPAVEAEIMERLRNISGQLDNSGQRKAILCATHVLGSLDKCRDILVLSKGGHVEFLGKPSDYVSVDYAKDYTKAWLGKYRELTSGRVITTKNTSFLASIVRRVRSFMNTRTKDTRPALTSGAFRATLKRLGRSVIVKPLNFLLFAGVPLVVSALLLWACDKMLDNGDVGTFYFCMTVAMFWFGLTGTFRTLVSERVPKRCLDRMRGMPLWRYFTAHATFALTYSFVQSLIFVLLIFLFRLGRAPEFTFYAFPAFWFDLGLVGFSGGCVGLFVSAYMKKELYAVWFLPLVAIPVLFMSKPVLEGGENSRPTGVLRGIECLMPTMYPQTVLETTMERAKVYHVMPDPEKLNDKSVEEMQARSVASWTNRLEKIDKETGKALKDKTGKTVYEEGSSKEDKHKSNRLRFFGLMAGYAVGGLGLAFLLQRWRERQYDGR